MIAEVIRPLKSRQVLELEHSLIRQNLGTELDKKRRELYNKLAAEYGKDLYEGRIKLEDLTNQVDNEEMTVKEKENQRRNQVER